MVTYGYAIAPEGLPGTTITQMPDIVGKKISVRSWHERGLNVVLP
jgi:hypothetical protein